MPDTVTVSGPVTLDGEPVPTGQVLFIDPAGVLATCAGPIKDGNYSFACTPGTKRVEISWLKEVPAREGAVGGIPGDPVSTENPAVTMSEAIPEKFNVKSELTINLTRDGTHQFPFELKSQ